MKQEQIKEKHADLLEKHECLESEIQQLRSKSTAIREAASEVPEDIWGMIYVNDGRASSRWPYSVDSFPRLNTSQHFAIQKYGKFAVQLKEKEKELSGLDNRLAGLSVLAITEGVTLPDDKEKDAPSKRLLSGKRQRAGSVQGESAIPKLRNVAGRCLTLQES